MGRVLILAYGLVCYTAFFAAFLYLIGFLTNIGVPRGMDEGAAGGIGIALVINLSLIALFGIQHSVMAREWFKRWWVRIVPRPVERSTYVLATSLVLSVLFWLWQPMPQILWQLDNPWLRFTAWGVFAAGLLVVLLSTFMIDHFDLFGLRQIYYRFMERPYRHPRFKVVSLYRLVRHPLYSGFFLMLWATPDMTLGRLVFAAGMTAYVLIAVRYEERDIETHLGRRYVQYRESVPRFIPVLGRFHEKVDSGEAAPSGMR